jgi:hypothetical protein
MATSAQCRLERAGGDPGAHRQRRITEDAPIRAAMAVAVAAPHVMLPNTGVTGLRSTSLARRKITARPNSPYQAGLAGAERRPITNEVI